MAALLCDREKKKGSCGWEKAAMPPVVGCAVCALWIANDSNPPSGMGSFDKKPESKPK